MTSGYDNFKALYSGNTTDPVAWDISQLKNEQKTLQPIHEEYLSGHDTFLGVSKYMTDSDKGAGSLPADVPGISGGVKILDYRSRVEFGCKLLGYNASQGCVP